MSLLSDHNVAGSIPAIPTNAGVGKIRHLNEQDLQTLLQSEDNYYNSKRSNTQSFQNFIRILIVVFLGAFISNTPWNSLHAPALAYIGAASLIISIILNIYTFPMAQNALEQVRELTHKIYDENNITYIDEIQNAYKKQNRLLKSLMVFLLIGIVVCPISYIYEKSVEPKEVTQMAKKQQLTQQPSRKVGRQVEKGSWDPPSRPITPTPADTAPPNTPAQPAQPGQQPAKPEQQPAQPVKPEQQPSAGKK